MNSLLLLLILILTFYCHVVSYKFEATLGAIKPQASHNIQELAVLNLMKRILPGRYGEFTVKVDPNLKINGKELFKVLKMDSGRIHIEGTTGVAVSSGLNYYLKYFCRCHISWEVSQLNLPAKLPEANVTICLNDRFRFYQNVCTTSYSFVWWNWNQWEKHIDWMVLNSFNLVLAFTSQEAIWNRVYKRLNLTNQEIYKHFAGPAFLSWLRMGNIRGWAGPLHETWHIRSLDLQHKILTRMRSLGIITVLPAFAGHVPRAFNRIFPNAQMTRMGNWNQFPEPYCCPNFLNPADDLFRIVGKMFIEEQISEYGTDHVYSCDSFNEMDPPESSLSYISSVGKNIYRAMVEIDSNAIWVMQGWLFIHSFIFWTPERVKALLTAIPNGKMIILDLQSEQFPQYQRYHQYFGQPYVWCMLHNFGGTLGMFGSSSIINKAVISARTSNNSTMIGIGLSMEGINQNYVIYDLMTESAWRTAPANLSKWFKSYSRRRYGTKNRHVEDAWEKLKDTIYDYAGVSRLHGQYAITRSPDLYITTWTWYNYMDLFEIWASFMMASDELKDSLAYLHDLVDLTRQVLQVNADIYYNKLMLEFRNKAVADFQLTATIFRGIFNDLESILATNEAFLLGRWLNAAKKTATNNMEAIMYDYNARNQISLWGPFGEIKNYAIKQWSGITMDFLYLRWNAFIDSMNLSLVENSTFNSKKIKSKIFWQNEVTFCLTNKQYPVTPTGNTIETAKAIWKKPWYTSLGIHNFNNFSMH